MSFVPFCVWRLLALPGSHPGKPAGPDSRVLLPPSCQGDVIAPSRRHPLMRPRRTLGGAGVVGAVAGWSGLGGNSRGLGAGFLGRKPAFPGRSGLSNGRVVDPELAPPRVHCKKTCNFNYRLACFFCSGCSSSFWTRQLMISATNSTFSDGHAISWTHPNCFNCRPDSPSTPSTLPSRLNL
jgi:hypothetical protein